MKIEFHQHDWIPGFAAFAPKATTPAPDSRAFCVLNLGSVLAAVEARDMPAADIPYLIAESMMHEVMHGLVISSATSERMLVFIVYIILTAVFLASLSEWSSAASSPTNMETGE